MIKEWLRANIGSNGSISLEVEVVPMHDQRGNQWSRGVALNVSEPIMSIVAGFEGKLSMILPSGGEEVQFLMVPASARALTSNGLIAEPTRLVHDISPLGLGQ